MDACELAALARLGLEAGVAAMRRDAIPGPLADVEDGPVPRVDEHVDVEGPDALSHLGRHLVGRRTLGRDGSLAGGPADWVTDTLRCHQVSIGYEPRVMLDLACGPCSQGH